MFGKGGNMYLTQGDLFWGMDGDFVTQVMNQSEKVDFDDGAVMFNQDETADYFYVLIKGRVKLSIGTQGPVVFIATEAGMVIGWSSLVGRETYSATALCVTPVKVVRIEKKSFSGKTGTVSCQRKPSLQTSGPNAGRPFDNTVSQSCLTC